MITGRMASKRADMLTERERMVMHNAVNVICFLVPERLASIITTHAHAKEKR